MGYQFSDTLLCLSNIKYTWHDQAAYVLPKMMLMIDDADADADDDDADADAE